MMSSASMAAASCGSWLSSFWGVLSALFGADGEMLDEDAILRLVDDARAGDRAARQRLYRQHVNRVFRTVRGLVRSEAEAEDVTQDAMLTALTSLDRFSPRAGVRFGAWLTTIAVNTATGDLPDVPAIGADPGDELDTARQQAVLLAAVAELEPREREIVSLRYGAELSAAEIAAQLGLEAANVRKILERARVRLAERIDARMNTTGGFR